MKKSSSYLFIPIGSAAKSANKSANVVSLHSGSPASKDKAKSCLAFKVAYGIKARLQLGEGSV